MLYLDTHEIKHQTTNPSIHLLPHTYTQFSQKRITVMLSDSSTEEISSQIPQQRYERRSPVPAQVALSRGLPARACISTPLQFV